MKVTLWKWMRDHQVTPLKLSLLLGEHQNNVYRWIKRQNEPHVTTCERIREKLGIPDDVKIDWTKAKKYVAMDEQERKEKAYGSE